MLVKQKTEKESKKEHSSLCRVMKNLYPKGEPKTLKFPEIFGKTSIQFIREVHEWKRSLVAEFQERIEVAEESQNMWYDEKVQGFIEAYKEVLVLLGFQSSKEEASEG